MLIIYSQRIYLMKAQLIQMLVSLLMRILTPDLLKKFADMTLDFIENYVAGTKSKIDDALILPLCDMIRKSFDIPDNDL
jgi:hypothetical protein